MKHSLDEYLLELILMDSLVYSSSRPIPNAEGIIQGFVPPDLYDRIIERYDLMSDDLEDEAAILPPRWQRRALRKSAAWKRMMVERFMLIHCQAGCEGCRGPVEVAALACKIGAARECRQLFARLGNQTPCACPRPGVWLPLRL